MSTTRECGCPPWVEPCVHFDGRVLILALDDRDEANGKGHTCRGGSRPFDSQGFSVHLTSGKMIPCGRTPDCPVVVFEAPCEGCIGFDTRTAARAEFDRRAAQLVGHE